MQMTATIMKSVTSPLAIMMRYLYECEGSEPGVSGSIGTIGSIGPMLTPSNAFTLTPKLMIARSYTNFVTNASRNGSPR